MADIVTGILGMILFVIFLGFVLVKIADVAFWVVSAGAVGCMIYAFWGESVLPALRNGNAKRRA